MEKILCKRGKPINLRHYGTAGDVEENVQASASSSIPSTAQTQALSNDNQASKQEATEISLRDRALAIYKNAVVYHVTEEKHVKSIRKHGLSIDRKKSENGATAFFVEKNGDNLPKSIVANAISNTKRYNYVMDNKPAAQALARALGNNYKNPAVVRLLADRSIFGEDTDFRASDRSALRTTESIPDALNSKSKKPSSAEQKMMKRRLALQGVSVSSKEAGKLLREVQSDSEDDL